MAEDFLWWNAQRFLEETKGMKPAEVAKLMEEVCTTFNTDRSALRKYSWIVLPEDGNPNVDA